MDNKQNCFATGQITLVTKVCHGFGIHHCRDRTIATSGVLNLPVAGDIIRTLSARCRSGTNSYKVHVNVHWVEEEADVEDGLPIISYSGKDEDTESPYVKITC